MQLGSCGILMVQKSGVHQLRLVVYLSIYREFCIPGGAGFLPSIGFMDFLFFFFDPASKRHQIPKVKYYEGQSNGIVAAKCGVGFEGPVRNVRNEIPIGRFPGFFLKKVSQRHPLAVQFCVDSESQA